MDSGYIFLAGGSITDSEEVDEVYFGMHNANDTILYIPIALGDDKHESCLEWFASLISHHADASVLMFDAIARGDQVPELANYKSVYLGGGNTYELLEYVCSTGLDKKLMQYVQAGGIVYGGSAGAMILGKDIRTAEEENLQNSSEHKGLDLLKGHSVICHYNDGENKEEEQRILAITQTIDSDVFALPNTGALLLDLKKQTAKPYGTVFIFKKNKRVMMIDDYLF